MKKIFPIILCLALLNSTLKAQTSSSQAKVSIFQNYTIENGVTNNNFLDLLKSSYSFGKNDGYKLVKTENDNIGFTHFKYNQTYNGIEVFGSQIIVHEKNEFVTLINGAFIPNISVTTTPTITSEQAINAAKTALGYSSYAWEKKSLEKLKRNKTLNLYPTPTLCIFSINEKEPMQLCWKFDISSSNIMYNWKVFIDATTGKLIKKISLTHPTDVTCTGTTNYNGSKTFLGSKDITSNSYIYYENATRGLNHDQEINTLTANNGTDPNFFNDIYNSNTNFNTDYEANSVHWAMEKTYDYYVSKFQRYSYDNNSSIITNVVHYDNAMNNAAWAGGQYGAMIYGDGDGTSYNPFTAVDVEGHELSHGVTENSAALIYDGESGALNESFSDIMAIGVEQYAVGSAYNWTIGENIVLGTPTYLRSMSNPKSADYPQPNTYNGQYWGTTVGCVADQTNDNCWVHINSGVQNYWFYLLSQGGSGTNDKGYHYLVTGITLDKALKIVYRMQTTYLTNTSKYADAVNGSLQSAIDLYGNGSAEYNAVKQAWCAVNLGSNCYPASAADMAKNTSISIYPNPTTGKILINNIEENFDYKVTNMIGASLQIGKVSKANNSIQLPNLPNGIYSIQFTNETINFSKQIVISQ